MDIDRCLTDPSFYATGEPHEIWTHLRREDPVHWTKSPLSFGGFWSLTRHADVTAAYCDPKSFSSERNGVAMPTTAEQEQIPREQLGFKEMMILTDPPLHAAMRRAFNRLFLPRSVGRYDTRGREIVSEILGEVIPRGECDFVRDVAVKLPMAFICEMMAIPRQDWELMFQWTNMALGADDPEFQIGSAAETSMTGITSVYGYCVKLALERRGASGDDLLTIIGNAEINGRKLNEHELGHNGFQFVAGGMETTRNAISGGMLALIKHPDQRRRLVDDPSLMPTAVEEILRWTSPVTQIMRTATRDIEMRGKTIHEGDRVLLWNASANRDEEVFAEPFKFDVARTPNEHLAFGIGEHYCIGAHLARLEIRLMLEALLRQMPDIELAGEPERLQSMLLAGIKHMPVRFTPHPAGN